MQHVSTCFIWEHTSLSIHDEEKGIMELPSSFTKQDIYEQFCYEQGWKICSDTKGKYPKLKGFLIQENDNLLWPAGSECLPVCAWQSFMQAWNKDVMNLQIRKPSEDICGKCLIFKNAFRSTGK